MKNTDLQNSSLIFNPRHHEKYKAGSYAIYLGQLWVVPDAYDLGRRVITSNYPGAGVKPEDADTGDWVLGTAVVSSSSSVGGTSATPPVTEGDYLVDSVIDDISVQILDTGRSWNDLITEYSMLKIFVKLTENAELHLGSTEVLTSDLVDNVRISVSIGRPENDHNCSLVLDNLANGDATVNANNWDTNSFKVVGTV